MNTKEILNTIPETSDAPRPQLSELAKTSDTVGITGVAIGRNAESIFILLGPALLTIPINSIIAASEDSSVPAIPAESGKYLTLTVAASTVIRSERAIPAGQLGTSAGIKPFVLATPTQGLEYSVSLEEQRARDAQWAQNLGLEGTYQQSLITLMTTYTTTYQTSYSTPYGTPFPTSTPGGDSRADSTQDTATDTKTDSRRDANDC